MSMKLVVAFCGSPRKTAMLFTQAAPDGAFRAYIDSTVDLFRFLNSDIRYVLIVAGTQEPVNIMENKDLIEKTFSIGASLVD